jgi:hypothetical protein
MLVYYSLYTGCIYRVLTPHELKNQVVNLQNIITGHGPGMREQQMLTAMRVATDGFPYSSCRRESYIIRLSGDDYEPRSVGRSVATKAFPHNRDDSTSGSGSSTGPGRRFPLVMDLGQETRGCC